MDHQWNIYYKSQCPICGVSHLDPKPNQLKKTHLTMCMHTHGESILYCHVGHGFIHHIGGEGVSYKIKDINKVPITSLNPDITHFVLNHEFNKIYNHNMNIDNQRKQYNDLYDKLFKFLYNVYHNQYKNPKPLKYRLKLHKYIPSNEYDILNICEKCNTIEINWTKVSMGDK